MKIRLLSVLALAAACVATGLALDDDTTTASVKFSDPAKPGTLRIDIPWGDLKVRGGDVAQITVRSSLNEKSKSKRTKDGLRRLDEEVSFELVEKDNIVTLSVSGDNAYGAQGAEFEIDVPRSTSLELKTDIGGDIDVRAVEGDIGVETMNGEVNLTDLVSSASVSTMNGEISAAFKAPPVKPVSFSSMNGEIQVRLPAATKANLRMRTHNGSILTDFSEDALKTKAETKVRTGEVETPEAPEPPDVDVEITDSTNAARRELRAAAQEIARNAVQIAAEVSREVSRAVADGRTPRPARAPRAPRAPIPPIFGGKAILGTLNGGGTDISLTSMNGSITVREVK